MPGTFHAKELRPVTVPGNTNMWFEEGGFREIAFDLTALVAGGAVIFPGAIGRYVNRQGNGRLEFSTTGVLGGWIGTGAGPIEESRPGAWHLKVAKLESGGLVIPGSVSAQGATRGIVRRGG